MDQSELISTLQNLKQDPGYQYLMDTIAAWELQANEDVMMKRNPDREEEDRGEWMAYRRVRKLVDERLKDLQSKPADNGVSDFDPYSK